MPELGFYEDYERQVRECIRTIKGAEAYRRNILDKLRKKWLTSPMKLPFYILDLTKITSSKWMAREKLQSLIKEKEEGLADFFAS